MYVLVCECQSKKDIDLLWTRAANGERDDINLIKGDSISLMFNTFCLSYTLTQSTSFKILKKDDFFLWWSEDGVERKKSIGNIDRK